MTGNLIERWADYLHTKGPELPLIVYERRARDLMGIFLSWLREQSGEFS
jgi:hypothetical protein